MPFGDDPGKWNCGLCESCIKNANEKIEMVCESLEFGKGMLVCPQCGATKGV